MAQGPGSHWRGNRSFDAVSSLPQEFGPFRLLLQGTEMPDRVAERNSGAGSTRPHRHGHAADTADRGVQNVAGTNGADALRGSGEQHVSRHQRVEG